MLMNSKIEYIDIEFQSPGVLISLSLSKQYFFPFRRVFLINYLNTFIKIDNFIIKKKLEVR